MPMLRQPLATIVVLLVLSGVALLVGGCNRLDESRSLTVESATEYFRKLPIGYGVNQIESELKLPSPAETEAPASDWPNWKFCYFAGDVVVYFEAECSEENENDRVCAYAGNLSITSMEQHGRALREKEHWHILREKEQRKYAIIAVMDVQEEGGTDNIKMEVFEFSRRSDRDPLVTIWTYGYLPQAKSWVLQAYKESIPEEMRPDQYGILIDAEKITGRIIMQFAERLRRN